MSLENRKGLIDPQDPHFSVTRQCSICLDTVQDSFFLGKPEIFNTDQGVQFTCTNFTTFLEKSNIRISMDGKGRWIDNVFIERLWRSVKYESTYLKEYETPLQLHEDLKEYFDYYNNRRPHQSFDQKSPIDIYRQKLVKET